jgi:phage anti-repressor protein
MNNLINSADNIQVLIDKWLEQEQRGTRFPVDFDTAWHIAGYSNKANAKRKLEKLVEGSDFSSIMRKNGQRGRSSHSINLTCDAFKHFCLLAETEEGRQIRQYFIECEKKWNLVQKHRPDVVAEIEILQLKLQLAQAEAQKALAEKAVLDTRHLIVATCPEPVQQKILGYEIVEKIEYRDRIIQDNQIINDGSTVTKTALCKRYGFMTKNGKPDYAKLNKHLEALKIPDYAWKNVPSVRDNQELRRDYLGELDKMILDDSRQLWFGE